ncbi:hypothetical protein B296_00012878 [Ensete ventricosum]|uniref:Retrotransposon gag domain-containing protein n=1 Tax=Ensete ventricosum TaxID=4639 RepID=A0A426Z8G4_ENSVE|nr:hypothetical protein B296_00012878 [Ensete ventricosum]
MIGIMPSRLFWSLVERPLTVMPEMLQRAVEALVAEKREDQKRPWAEPSRGPPPGLPRKRTERAEEKGFLKTPNPMRTRAEEWDHGCYCCFHRDYGHNTEECYDLKNQIEDIIRHDHLNRYIRKSR